MEENGFVFSSANSINIGRLVPQIVYYFHAYFQAVKMGEIQLGDDLNFTVPTGNFGDILAGYYAKRMGLPVKQLLCASNDNKVLYDFFQTGEYNKNRAFAVTVSPSMDILISSNLERFLCDIVGQEKTADLMENLGQEGRYEVEIKSDAVVGEYATEDETFATIKGLFHETGYVMDTHTAVAYAAYQKYKNETKDTTPTVVVSTASPYKFTKDVMIALDEKYATGDAFALMDELEKLSKVEIPMPIRGIEKREVLHKNVCERDGIKEFVKEQLFGK